MCECEFEYGEELEFSDDFDFRNSDIDKFWGYQPKSDHPYCDKLGYKWKYARHPLPKLRDGDWIIVLYKNGTETGRKFSHFSERGDVYCFNGTENLDPKGVSVWTNGWKPMPHYDYNHE
jgi:hypothetical protein